MIFYIEPSIYDLLSKFVSETVGKTAYHGVHMRSPGSEVMRTDFHKQKQFVFKPSLILYLFVFFIYKLTIYMISRKGAAAIKGPSSETIESSAR